MLSSSRRALQVKQVVMTKGHSDNTSRAPWKRELAIMILVALATTVVFWLTDLDIVVSGVFFDEANPENPWHRGDAWLWRALYEADWIFTVILLAISGIFIISGLRSAGRRTSVRYGVFIILSTAIGAGLLVNSALKKQWGRPRPDAIVEFGGDLEYRPPWLKGPKVDGESFPSGHAAIAFSFLALWLVFRGRRRNLASLCFWGSIALGSLAGLGRIVQGRHFLSDVFWSLYVIYLVSVLLFYTGFRFPCADLTNQTNVGARPD
jgi:membrane-associated PAP2 superfamily phosphatase